MHFDCSFEPFVFDEKCQMFQLRDDDGLNRLYTLINQYQTKLVNVDVYVLVTSNLQTFCVNVHVGIDCVDLFINTNIIIIDINVSVRSFLLWSLSVFIFESPLLLMKSPGTSNTGSRHPLLHDRAETQVLICISCFEIGLHVSQFWHSILRYTYLNSKIHVSQFWDTRISILRYKFINVDIVEIHVSQFWDTRVSILR